MSNPRKRKKYHSQSDSRSPIMGQRGYGSARQDERAQQKSEWATKNPNSLMTADELIAENKRREQADVMRRLGR